MVGAGAGWWGPGRCVVVVEPKDPFSSEFGNGLELEQSEYMLQFLLAPIDFLIDAVHSVFYSSVKKKQTLANAIVLKYFEVLQ